MDAEAQLAEMLKQQISAIDAQRRKQRRAAAKLESLRLRMLNEQAVACHEGRLPRPIDMQKVIDAVTEGAAEAEPQGDIDEPGRPESP